MWESVAVVGDDVALSLADRDEDIDHEIKPFFTLLSVLALSPEFRVEDCSQIARVVPLRSS
jgi:hypothetical protein